MTIERALIILENLIGCVYDCSYNHDDFLCKLINDCDIDRTELEDLDIEWLNDILNEDDEEQEDEDDD